MTAHDDDSEEGRAWTGDVDRDIPAPAPDWQGEVLPTADLTAEPVDAQYVWLVLWRLPTNRKVHALGAASEEAAASMTLVDRVIRRTVRVRVDGLLP